MAKCSITLTAPDRQPDEIVETEMTIVGGGISGILAAKMCGDRQWPYVLVERSEELGGVWNTLANNHSYLQASGVDAGNRRGSKARRVPRCACDH